MDDFPNVPSKDLDSVHHDIRSGDILLCSGTSFFSNLIQNATRSPWSHVAFILRLEVINRIMVLESVESVGVRAVTLNHYLQDYNGTGKRYPGTVMLARHHDVQPENIKKLSQFATNLLGYPYATDEILRIAARIGMNSLGLHEQKNTTMPQREFICSEYAYVCFKSIGINIHFDGEGFIAPADFMRCREVKPLFYLTENSLIPSVEN